MSRNTPLYNEDMFDKNRIYLLNIHYNDEPGHPLARNPDYTYHDTIGRIEPCMLEMEKMWIVKLYPDEMDPDITDGKEFFHTLKEAQDYVNGRPNLYLTDYHCHSYNDNINRHTSPVFSKETGRLICLVDAISIAEMVAEEETEGFNPATRNQKVQNPRTLVDELCHQMAEADRERETTG